MSHAAISALHAECTHARELITALTADEWAAPSGCAGWRVQDVVCHMASVFQTIADPASIEGGSSEDAESNAEVPVQARRTWSAEQVAAAYLEWSEKGVAALTALQDPPMADTVIPLGNLGYHPMHILANAIVFDHYCHLRHDIGAAVERAAALAHDDDALQATVEWMLAGLPQMCAPALAAQSQAINLVFEGPAAGAYTLAPGDGLWTVTPGAQATFPTVRTTAHDFVSWGTQRGSWRTMATIEGDVAAAAPVLDAINVI